MFCRSIPHRENLRQVATPPRLLGELDFGAVAVEESAGDELLRVVGKRKLAKVVDMPREDSSDKRLAADALDKLAGNGVAEIPPQDAARPLLFKSRILRPKRHMAHHYDRKPFLDRLLERGGNRLRHRSKRIVEHEEVSPAKLHGRGGDTLPFVLELRDGRHLVGLDFLLVGVKPILVIAHTRDDTVGTNAARGILDVRDACKIHKVAGVNDLDPPGAGMVDRLPEIVFAKTTQAEEGGSGAYTIKNIIFLGEISMDACMPNAERAAEVNHARLMWFAKLVAHELFHCVSRHSPEFRQKMYSLIGFTVMDHDITFPDAIRQRIAINPDVEHMDNYAEFTINGQKRRCELILLYDKSWKEASAEKGDDIVFFLFVKPTLVPLDDMTKVYDIAEASDFWTTVGQNTDYVIAPEECMADNFSYAVIQGMNPAKPYKSPELIRNIITALKQL